MDGVRHDYTYASGQLLRESFTQGGTAYTLDFLYDPDGRPYLLYLTTTTGSTTVSAPYYYILNLQGDVIHLVNTSGAAVASYTYDPYGSPLTATGSLATVNPLRYRGYYYDPEKGFYYLQSRYYDPALGRFLNADSYASTGQGFLGYNMFAYCKNSPVSHNDPNGKMMVCCVETFSGGGRSAPTCVSSATPHHHNKETICTMFGVDEVEHVPGYEKGCMFFVENTQTVSVGFVSIIRGKTIVMDQDRYCQYSFFGVSPGLSLPGVPGDVTIAEGIVYGVNSPSDYSGFFGGATANMVATGGGGTIAPNGVSARILILRVYATPSFGVSGTYYIQESYNWIYGKAPLELSLSPPGHAVVKQTV